MEMEHLTLEDPFIGILVINLRVSEAKEDSN